MEPQEISGLKNEIRAQEKASTRKFTLYTGFMVILGISIGVWSVLEGNRAKRFQLQSELSQRKIDSLEVRIRKANDRLALLQEKLLNSHLINSHIRIALDNFYSRRYEMAINEYNQAIILDPDNFVLYDLRGYSQLQLKRIDEAIQSLKKSVELKPNYAWGYYDLSLAYWADGDKQETRNTLQKLLEVSPEFRSTILNDSQFQAILRDADIKKLLR